MNEAEDDRNSRLVIRLQERLKHLISGALVSIAVLLFAGCSSDEQPKKISLSNGLTNEQLRNYVPDRNVGVYWFGFDRRSSAQEDARQYLPFLRYLSEATGLRFELYFVPKNKSIVELLGRGGIQFAAIGAGSYIQARTKFDVIPLVHGLNPEGKPQYRSVIIVRPDSQIKKLKNLRNKRFAFGGMTSTQGHLIPRIVLANSGITLQDLASYDYTGSHRNCADAVLSGRVDACGMQDTMGFALAESGLVRILYTSKYYPSSCIAANKAVSQEVLARVQQALLHFEPKGKHSTELYHWERTEMPNGFAPAQDADYAELRDWMNKLAYFPERMESKP